MQCVQCESKSFCTQVCILKSWRMLYKENKSIQIQFISCTTCCSAFVLLIGKTNLICLFHVLTNTKCDLYRVNIHQALGNYVQLEYKMRCCQLFCFIVNSQNHFWYDVVTDDMVVVKRIPLDLDIYLKCNTNNDPS